MTQEEENKNNNINVVTITIADRVDGSVNIKVDSANSINTPAFRLGKELFDLIAEYVGTLEEEEDVSSQETTTETESN